MEASGLRLREAAGDARMQRFEVPSFRRRIGWCGGDGTSPKKEARELKSREL